MSCLNKQVEGCVFPALLSFVGTSLYMYFLLLILSHTQVLALLLYSPNNRQTDVSKNPNTRIFKKNIYMHSTRERPLSEIVRGVSIFIAYKTQLKQKYLDANLAN